MTTTFLSENQWRSILVVLGAIVTYLLLQSDVPLEGWVKVGIGAANVALIALSPNRLAGSR